ncbi:DUF6262 family protein [Streptomyces sp. NPDC052023]|uniref:DUF6262 family protein n=1 Tax=Streptomyces sp. NPDC052023 TaxID=3365681 RepID=UPI0037D3A856
MIPAMRDGRQAETERRRQRVATAVKNDAKNGTPISVSAIARQAGVDRSFLYRHRHLLGIVHAAELERQPRTRVSRDTAERDSSAILRG